MEEKIISIEELSQFGSIQNLNEQALSLVEQQKATWEIPGKNFEALNRIQIRDFDFGHFKITAQFNAERIRSSAAKTDAKSIAERLCFLCIQNLPHQQKGILFDTKYIVLTNPYPIFAKHLTISKLEHIPQQIVLHFSDLLEISRNLPSFTVFYNGPKCGASAPDHFHFQAVNPGNLPVEKEFELLENRFSETLFEKENSIIVAVEHYLRRFIAIISSEKNFVAQTFEFIYKLLETNEIEEPMMNILCNYSENKWRVIIFPREKQRSSHFFREGEKQLMVSPATVEMGGTLILPREKDFRKITRKEIAEIYNEVTINQEKFKNLTDQIKSSVF